MGVFYMFLSESDYDSLCTFPLQLSWGPHSHFFLLADYLLRHICDCICNFSHLQIISALYLWPHSQFFPLADYLCSILVTAFTIILICRLSLLYTCDCIRTFFHLQIISCAILVTAFTIFLICRLSPAPYLWPHFQLSLICRLSLRHTCDRIRNFSHLQIISCAILVTAFTIILICRLSPLYTCDCIRTFFHLQIISCATPPLRLCWGCLQAGAIPCMDKEYSPRLALRDAG